MARSAIGGHERTSLTLRPLPLAYGLLPIVPPPAHSALPPPEVPWLIRRPMSKTALLFAGQGAQIVGMGKDLAERYPNARQWFDRANAALGYDLASICFKGPDEELTRTEHAQPAIYLVGWVAFQLLRERIPDLHFEATAGLSLGEFTALAAAGVFAPEDGLRLVHQRGQFMEEACAATEGSMAAIIGLEEGPTRAVCTQAGVELANLNCPGQLVISGPRANIERACELARAAGARNALPLPVAGAYHSRLMASAQPKLQAAVAGVELRAPQVPVISNVTAQPHDAPDAIRARLVQQVTASVRWEAGMRTLLAQGFTRFIELGPGRTLCGFLKRIDRQAQLLNIADVPSLDDTVRALGGSPEILTPVPA